VSAPAAAAIDRVATRAARATDNPVARGTLERLAASARTALSEGRPAARGARLDVLAKTMGGEAVAALGALSDDLPVLPSDDGRSFERIASLTQLRRARAFLDAL
jgi:hypothetical protein